MSLNSLRNFCRVLQISPKHFKISKYKGCLVIWGTQLFFWVAFQILSGNWWKSQSTAVFPIHRSHEKIELCLTFLLKPMRKYKKTFVKVVEEPFIYNFANYTTAHFYSNFWSFSRSNSVKWKENGPCHVALRSRTPTSCARARAPTEWHPPPFDVRALPAARTEVSHPKATHRPSIWGRAHGVSRPMPPAPGPRHVGRRPVPRMLPCQAPSHSRRVFEAKEQVAYKEPQASS
jgi:hypothetical protein